MDGKEPLISDSGNQNAQQTYRSYWYRWYILGIFSCFSFIQTAIWNTWGPISVSAKCTLGFTDHDIELLANWVSIAVMPSMPFFIVLLNRSGVRWAVVIGTFCVALGTVLRCLPVNAHPLKYLIHTAHFLNGIAGCAVLGVPPMISNLWFRPRERVTATSLMILLGNIGNAFSFLVGPLIVENPSNGTLFGIIFMDNDINLKDSASVCVSMNGSNVTNIATMRNQIDHLMFIHCGIAVFLFIAIAVYFPNKPPSPPSSSAAVERLPFKSAAKLLLRARVFWVIVFTQSLIIGSYFSWSGVFSDLYSHFGISQTEAGWVGFTMTLVGVAVGVVIGWFTDRFANHMKKIVVALICTIFVVFLYLVVSSMQWIDWAPFHFTHVTMWICCLLVGVAINSFQPLIIEMAVDHAYPVSEGISNSILTWFTMLSMFIFLTILNAIADQTVANYLLLAFSAISIPFFVFMVPQRNRRLEIDTQKSSKDDDLEEGSGSVNMQ